MKLFVRIAVRVVAALVAAVFIFVGYNIFDIWNSGQKDEREKADAIVVLGAAQYNGRPSPVLKARLDHAVTLWKQGWAPTIVVTGGRGVGDRNSEAGASARYLGEQGVPDRSVLREVQGRSSWESLQAATVFMKQRDINKVILVSDPFHSARIREMSKDLGMEPLVSPTRTSPIGGSEELRHYAKETVSLSFGRAFGFSRLAGLERDFSS